MTIKIPNCRGRSRNETNYSHWRFYQGVKAELGQFIRAYAKRPKYPFRTPVNIKVTAYYKGKRGVDASNIDLKIYCDVLQELGIIEDDDPKHNPSVCAESITETGKDEVVIEITAL